MIGLKGVTPLKKTDSPSTSSYQFPVSPQLGDTFVSPWRDTVTKQFLEENFNGDLQFQRASGEHSNRQEEQQLNAYIWNTSMTQKELTGNVVGFWNFKAHLVTHLLQHAIPPNPSQTIPKLETKQANIWAYGLSLRTPFLFCSYVNYLYNILSHTCLF